MSGARRGSDGIKPIYETGIIMRVVTDGGGDGIKSIYEAGVLTRSERLICSNCMIYNVMNTRPKTLFVGGGEIKCTIFSNKQIPILLATHALIRALATPHHEDHNDT